MQTKLKRLSVHLASRGSPTSQKIVFKHVKAARDMSLAKVLETDFRLLHHMCHISHDFVEGIRAKLIEKDNNAHWEPATVREVCCCHFIAISLSPFCSKGFGVVHRDGPAH